MDAPADYKHAGNIMVLAGGFKFLSVLYCYVPVCWLLVPFVLVIGVWEIRTGLKMREGELVEKVSTISLVGVVGAALGANVFSFGAAIYGMTILAKPELVSWLDAAPTLGLESDES